MLAGRLGMLAGRLLVATLLATSCSSKKADPGATASGSASVVSGAESNKASPITIDGDERFDPASLGSISFALTEGNASARARFQRGVLALHSFWYDEATRQFAAAIVADPTMNMARWGLAMSHLKLLWGEDDLEGAKSALSGMPNPERLSEREQAWVFATIALMKGNDVRAARVAYVQAMADVHARFPDDESATFLAVALLSAVQPEDADNSAVRERAASLARQVFDRNPKHPGAAHYLIHAYDTPELAPKALDVARLYSNIAPAAFHARHMPSHIFSRIGMWPEAIASCIAAWEASLAAAKRERLTGNHHDYHSLSWLVEMPFEVGKRSDADRWLQTFAEAVRDGLDYQHRTLYATEVGSYLVRTGEWSRVDELLKPLEAAPAPFGPATRADATAAHCASKSASPAEYGERLAVLDTRALAAAMQKDLATTRKLAAEIDVVRKALRPTLEKIQSREMLAELEKLHTRRKHELLARAKDDDRTLAKILRAAADDAHADTGGENNPSGTVAREQLAETLARLGQYAEAAKEFASALRQHPKRARSLLGAARTADALGDSVAARRYYAELAAQWQTAAATTPDLDEVRRAQ